MALSAAILLYIVSVLLLPVLGSRQAATLVLLAVWGWHTARSQSRCRSGRGKAARDSKLFENTYTDIIVSTFRRSSAKHFQES
ncbi:hypothetical protein AWB69_08926 [Caballeronia udeis]|uniref:Uncharacterized protein n=1 Tax=Caballeronia udeis TaxID=1232866 RepID=A0A158JVY6_9BURK|nr:hypothetical protein AWB69_08926 [Caballeronia udeis]